MKNSEWNDYQSSACAKQPYRRTPGGARNNVGLPAVVDGEVFGLCRLSDLLGVKSDGVVEEILRNSLFAPTSALTANHGKRVRGQLVNLAYRLVLGDGPASLQAARQCRIAAEVVELIHAGSLIVDDIEDGSEQRRGQPAVHVQYGTPLALNAGNWLYFWPSELLKDSHLPKDRLQLAYERYHRTLVRAHFGQAIDLGTKVHYLPQAAVAEVTLASIKLKTGALSGFAALLGGVVAGVSETVVNVLDDFGVDLGVALQMFDDLGNVIGKCDPLKRFEDLSLSRPSWVWACAAEHSDAQSYESFLGAVACLPDPTLAEKWLHCHGILEAGRASAKENLEQAFRRLERRLAACGVGWSARAFAELRQLGDSIAVAYG